MDPSPSSGFVSTQLGGTLGNLVGSVDARVIDNSYGKTINVHPGANIEIINGAQFVNSRSPPEEKLPSHPRCPAPCTGYVRRKHLEDHMSSYFFGPRPGGHLRKRYVLHGLGGSGKTQGALNFINENFYSQWPGQRRFAEAYWVDATSDETIKKSFEDIARSAGRSTYEDALVLLASHNAKSNWIVLYNNADDPSLDLTKYFPKCTHGNIFITTRNHQATRYGEGPGSDYAVSGMEHNEARELFINQARLFNAGPSTIQTMDGLLKELNYFPLSVRQSGTYIFSASCTPAEYINDFRNRREALLCKLDKINPEDYSYGTVEATLSLSFSRLSPGAQLLLQLFSWLHREYILEKILRDGFTGLRSYKRKYRRLASKGEKSTIASMNQFREELASAGSWDINKFRRFINELKSFSLVIYDPEQHAYSIHPLVQESTRGAVEKTMQNLLYQSTILLLGSAITINRDDTAEQLSFVRGLAPHIDELSKGELLVFDGCKNEFGYVYNQVGRWNDGKELREKYNKACQRALGQIHPKTLWSIHDLIRSYFGLGSYEKAAEIQSEVLEVEKGVLGMDHSYTLDSMNNLAVIFSSQGKYSKAAKMHTEVLGVKEMTYGPEHPSTLLSMSNLAATYSSKGKFKKAAKIQSEVLEMWRVKLGIYHPKTLASMNNLAKTYSRQLKFKESAELHSKVLEIAKAKLGEDHPFALKSAGNLAAVYCRQLKLKKATELQSRVVEFEKENFGADHPETLISMSNLAIFYLCQGRWIEAAKLFSAVRKIRKEKELQKMCSGPDYIQADWLMRNPPSTFQRQNRIAVRSDIHIITESLVFLCAGHRVRPCSHNDNPSPIIPMDIEPVYYGV